MTKLQLPGAGVQKLVGDDEEELKKTMHKKRAIGEGAPSKDYI